MKNPSRRQALGLLAAAGGAVTTATLTTDIAQAQPVHSTSSQEAASTQPITVVGPADARYPELTVGYDQMFTASPDYIALPTSPEQAVQAVQQAVNSGRRIAVASGGHSVSDFVYNQSVKAIIDTSQLNEIYYDAARQAFAVGAGSHLLNIYETLFKGWGVALPGGLCYSVGIAGHATGGGVGLLSREYGLVADHLDAVEVVVVDGGGTARSVVATRDPADPHNDLWWAHTGGGGGNFGVVTRFWFRTPGAASGVPGAQLMRPPRDVYVSAIALPWSQLDQAAFTRLVLNFGTFQQQHASPSDPYACLCGFLSLNNRAKGSVTLLTQSDATVPNAEQLHLSFLAAVTAGVNATPGSMTSGAGELAAHPNLVTPAKMPWLTAAKLIGTDNPDLTSPVLRSRIKNAYFRQSLTASQAVHLYQQLTRSDFTNPESSVTLNGFAGGKINAVSPSATATAHRDSAFLGMFQSWWSSSSDDNANIAWLRDIYSGLFAGTGGYPVSNEQTDGCYINMPDLDITDPQQNHSSVPWQTLYYGGNYSRLQRLKAKYDPLNSFQHPQSITSS
jgi:FAD binding domain/Berberine and berberine like